MHHKAVPDALRSTAAGAMAASSSSAAAAVLAASIILSPAADAPCRVGAVHADLARAVQLNDVTEEQAARFEAKLASHILGEA